MLNNTNTKLNIGDKVGHECREKRWQAEQAVSR